MNLINFWTIQPHPLLSLHTLTHSKCCLASGVNPLSFRLQDYPISSNLFIMILPSSLLSELAEICKLLVSDI